MPKISSSSFSTNGCLYTRRNFQLPACMTILNLFSVTAFKPVLSFTIKNTDFSQVPHFTENKTVLSVRILTFHENKGSFYSAMFYIFPYHLYVALVSEYSSYEQLRWNPFRTSIPTKSFFLCCCKGIRCDGNVKWGQK